ncbi:MAG: ornithine cyclodeaminase family protein [Deltaproteobacteria bacterium]|nr:ornithine cyclodeaminase family protein [Deltaproteobacteria bacterium]
MTLVLKNAEMGGLLPMGQNIEDMEVAFREYGQEIAVNRPRMRMYVPLGEPETYYWFNNIAGIVPGFKGMALRIDSSKARAVLRDGRWREEYPDDFVGLVLLFDIESCRLLAIMDDHYLSVTRVAATSAVAAKFLARQDAGVLGLFGTGEQARTQLEAMALVRPLRLAKVFSPNRANRERFAAEMAEKLKLEVRAVSDPLEVVRGADIINAATNAADPLVDGRWLEPGQHLSTLVGGDYRRKRDELDHEAYLRCDLIVVNTREQVRQDRQGNLFELLEAGKLQWESLAELGEIVAGKRSGRTGPRQITLCKNNHGMGIQFAVTARRIYELARARGIGRELDDELFLTRREGVWSP